MDDEEDAMGSDPESYEDPVAQRAAAFVQLARFADQASNATAQELTFTMMRKVSASIRTPPTAEVRSIDGGKA